LGQLGGLAGNAPSKIPVATSRLRAALPTAGGATRDLGGGLDTAASLASKLPGPLGSIGQMAQAGLGKLQDTKMNVTGEIANTLGQGGVSNNQIAKTDTSSAATLDQAADAQKENAKLQFGMMAINQQAQETKMMTDFLTSQVKNMCDALTNKG
jgi:hypothetical protein